LFLQDERQYTTAVAATIATPISSTVSSYVIGDPTALTCADVSGGFSIVSAQALGDVQPVSISGAVLTTQCAFVKTPNLSHIVNDCLLSSEQVWRWSSSSTDRFWSHQGVAVPSSLHTLKRRRHCCCNCCCNDCTIYDSYPREKHDANMPATSPYVSSPWE